MDCSKCIKTCQADCCGPVPIPKETVAKFLPAQPVEHRFDLGDHLVLVAANGKCAYLGDDHRCTIYNDRPDVCRKFGDESHVLMTCPYQASNGRIRTRQERRALERSTGKVIGKGLPMIR